MYTGIHPAAAWIFLLTTFHISSARPTLYSYRSYSLRIGHCSTRRCTSTPSLRCNELRHQFSSRALRNKAAPKINATTRSATPSANYQLCSVRSTRFAVWPSRPHHKAFRSAETTTAKPQRVSLRRYRTTENPFTHYKPPILHNQ